MSNIRPLETRDVPVVVDLSLRAWAPVFASLEQVLGAELFRLQHPDWRADQRAAVEQACTDETLTVWVAEEHGEVTGFVATRVAEADRLGEIFMIAVDPAYQRRGVGATLTAFAIERLQEAGLPVAMVETGGDPGHAPARALYEAAGFTLLPVARYFVALPPEGPSPARG